MKLRKVYFYWVCPDTNSFEWINDLLKNFDQQMAEEGLGEFLNYYIYLTRGWDKNQVGISPINGEVVGAYKVISCLSVDHKGRFMYTGT